MKEKLYTLIEISNWTKTPVDPAHYWRTLKSRMIKEGKLEASKIGRNYKVRESEVERFIDSCRYKNVR